MDNFDNSKDSRVANAAGWMVLITAVLILVYSIFEVFAFSFAQIVILAASIFVSALIGKHQARIPHTGATFLPKVVFAFWGIIWIGVSGGVLLGAASSIASNAGSQRKARVWLGNASRDVISAFVAAVAYHLALKYFTSPNAIVLAGNFSIPNEVIIASILMALAHHAISSILNYLSESGQLPQQIFVMPLTAYAVSLAATIVLFLTFNHFGIEFGLVIVPLAIAANLAYKIHIRSLEQKTRQITEASRMHFATVEALATAIDARDQVGIGHVRRTQIYAVGIGNILGLKSDEIDALRTGALLHDIGKLAVPDHILNKPGRLTPAEMEKAKIHSSVGSSILEKVGFQTPVVPTVKYHHESWDGSGYPEGLRGTNIPLTARILAVADAYDTLRGARPYRPAVSREDAANFLRAGAGAQFDPKLVDTFLRNLKIFEAEVDAEGLAYRFEPDRWATPTVLAYSNSNPNYVEQIKRANREVFTLYSLAKEFSAALSLQDTLSLFTRKIGEFVPFDTCIVYLADEKQSYAEAVYACGKNSDALTGKLVKIGEGATGYVLQKRVAVENVDPVLDFTFSHAEFGQDYKGMASLPLLADEKLIGAVSVYLTDADEYHEEHLRLLETVSRIAADAIAKSLQHAEAESHALTDPMTGLPNARSLQVQFEKEVKRSSRNGNGFHVLMLDLDGFKSVNDTFGHKTGDRMLKEIGGVIRGQLRDYDFLARYAGDEFVALVPETDASGVLELCRRIEAAIDEFALPAGEDLFAKVGVSLGSARYPNHGETFDQLIISADKAMYLAKAFHKQRNKRRDEQLQTVTLEEHISEQHEGTTAPAIVETDAVIVAEQYDFDDGLVVELDESHIVASAAIN